MVRIATHRRNAVVATLRWAVHKYALVLAVAAALGVGIMAQRHQQDIAAARAQVTDAVLPLAGVLHAPFDMVHAAVNRVRELSSLYDTNRQLERENMALRGWQQEAYRLQAENARLRSLTTVATLPAPQALTAPVVTEAGGTFERSLLVLAGVDSGVEEGSVVLGASGVVGRVTNVGSRAARVLLINDENSRIPVQLAGSGERAIATGTGSGDMDLTYLPADVVPTVGERVLTSGHGGIFPAGLPVGEVVKIQADGRDVYRIVPIERLNAQQWVRIVDYRASTDTR
jgi:rod shape-determining protein MreC